MYQKAYRKQQGDGRPGHYKAGDYYIICDRCGFKIPRSRARKTWDNLIVCFNDFEYRHPQDFVRGVRDRQAVPEPRSEAPDTFLDTNDVQPGDL